MYPCLILRIQLLGSTIIYVTYTIANLNPLSFLVMARVMVMTVLNGCVCVFLVPDSAPANITAGLNGTELLISWAKPDGKINGELQGYIIEYSTPNTEPVQ